MWGITLAESGSACKRDTGHPRMASLWSNLREIGISCSNLLCIAISQKFLTDTVLTHSGIAFGIDLIPTESDALRITKIFMVILLAQPEKRQCQAG